MMFLLKGFQFKRKRNRPVRVNHLKNPILVAKGTRES
jgi:hypothetical protein